MHSPGLDPRSWELITATEHGKGHDTGSHDSTFNKFVEHSDAQVLSTEVVIASALRRQYPDAHITNVPTAGVGLPRVDLLTFARAGKAEAIPYDDPNDPIPAVINNRYFSSPLNRLDKDKGVMSDQVLFGRYKYIWEGRMWLLYYVRCREYPSYPAELAVQFLLSGEGLALEGEKLSRGNGESKEDLQKHDDSLIRAATVWGESLHSAIWVFDSGFWIQSQDLYKAIMKSRWDDVILDNEQKTQLQNDVSRFFDNQGRYERLRVPWKRGVIYYGPPGNGKTISIKAQMHTMYNRPDPIPSLYVRSLRTAYGPEYAVRQIFAKARQNAPCLLIFEDLDSLVTPAVRSYFLNEVDGLTANDGILMIGSTNHLDQLDPGISKRPSRFDRKFLFDKPNLGQRTLYARFWRRKLTMHTTPQGKFDQLGADIDGLSLEDGEDDDYPDIEFPAELCPMIAGITQEFSFAYMQEAFVASLLAIAAEDDEDKDGSTYLDPSGGGPDDDMEHLRLWQEMKKQVRALREEM